MRKAAGVIMLVWGIFVIVGGLLVLLGVASAGTAHVWVLSALSVLIIAAGISVLRRRAYWWALLAAISMVVVGTTNAVWAWQETYLIPHDFDTATRVLMATGAWAIWGVPGLLALIFLVKRKGEFRASIDA